MLAVTNKSKRYLRMRYCHSVNNSGDLIALGNGDLKSTVYSVLGKEMSDSLMSVDYSFNDMRITGFVSKPTASRKSRAGQYFYINNRIVKSKTAMAALEQAYKNTIMVGRFPARY